MGETYGSTWTMMTYVMLAFVLFTLILTTFEVTSFQGGRKKIEDGLREGNFRVFDEMPRKFNACESFINGSDYLVDTTKNCSGVTDVDLSTGEIKYQLSFRGTMIKVNADGNDDFKVNLSY